MPAWVDIQTQGWSAPFGDDGWRTQIDLRLEWRRRRRGKKPSIRIHQATVKRRTAIETLALHLDPLVSDLNTTETLHQQPPPPGPLIGKYPK